MKWVLFACVFLLARSADAVTINFCFESIADYTDNHDDFEALANGVREDYYGTDTPKALRGVYARLTGGGTTYFDDYTADGLGSVAASCTGLREIGTLPRQVSFYLESRAKSQSHVIKAVEHNSQNLTTLTFTSIVGTGTPSGSTLTFTWSPSQEYQRDILRALNAAAYASYRHYGGVSGGDFVLDVGDTDNYTSGPSGSIDATVHLTDVGSERKFVVIHEFGHAIGRYSAGARMFGDCSSYLTACPSSTHSMGSREYQSCALAEGFAHFYAADVFNSHSSENCAFNYYKDEFGLGFPTVDCEGSTTTGDQSVNGDYPVAFMENKPCGSAWSGRGVEVDWARALWNIHSEQSSPTGPTFNAIMSWLRNANSWTNTSVYSELDAEASQIGGPLNTWWNSYSDEHGIDHP